MGSATSSRKRQAPQPVSSQRDETSEMKDELKKTYRRIADLETRIHDLTLQTSLVSVWHCYLVVYSVIYVMYASEADSRLCCYKNCTLAKLCS